MASSGPWADFRSLSNSGAGKSRRRKLKNALELEIHSSDAQCYLSMMKTYITSKLYRLTTQKTREMIVLKFVNKLLQKVFKHSKS